MSGLLIQGGRVVDPAEGRDEEIDLRIRDGLIAELGDLEPAADETVIAAKGLVVTPGLVDTCVHLREPGFEDVETIRTGARAALAGGFTAIAAMPDTDPPVDNEASATYVRLKGEEASAARVHPVGTLTKGRKGGHLSEMAGMARAGAVAFTDEDEAVERTDLFLKALRYSRMLDRPVLTRCEDPWLRGKGVANNGLVSDLLGLPGISAGTEEVMLGRNIHLARIEGASLHLLHLSTVESILQVFRAKQEGVNVTCGVTPYHLLLSEESVRSYDPAFRFMPPLRSATDREALINALGDGTIDTISSAHTPRGENEKALEFVFAAPGVAGLETTFSVLYTDLVGEGRLSLTRLVELLSTRPARILQVPGGRLRVGDPADLTCFDLGRTWTIEPRDFETRSRITPFAGRKVQGRVEHVVVGGRWLCRDGQITT